jgi:hypothetical protein
MNERKRRQQRKWLRFLSLQLENGAGVVLFFVLPFLVGPGGGGGLAGECEKV